MPKEKLVIVIDELPYWAEKDGQWDVYYEKVVKPRMHPFMGSVFEEMCRY